MLYNSLLNRTDSSPRGSEAFSILLRKLLKQGKPARKILYRTCLNIEISRGTSSLKFIYQAIRNLLPLIELSSSSNRPRPVPLLPNRSTFLAIDWLIQGAYKRTERTFSLRLCREIIDAHDKKGFAFKKKIEWHARCYAGFPGTWKNI